MAMNKIVSDFGILIPKLEAMGVSLAGGRGEGDPELNLEIACFNGPKKCGHQENSEISIPWPTETAGGVAKKWGENQRAGRWFAGAEIEKRCCDGDCSYETFAFPRVMENEGGWKNPDDRTGLYFDCCKTAFRPYDLAVNCFLIIAKHHLEEKILVSSDGETQHWAEGRIVCQEYLGYGIEFELDKAG